MQRILVFDDDPQVCDLLETALSDASCTVRRAASLEEGKRILQQEPIDLALVDTPMFNFTGVELGLYATARGIRVLMMVAGKDATLRVEAPRLPYILKPFRIADIVDRVVALLASDKLPEPNESSPVEQDPDGRG
jgi:DNA-binding response OmpR family regulator